MSDHKLFITTINAALKRIHREDNGVFPKDDVIAASLNNQNLTTFRGRAWNAATVRKFLLSRAYA